MKHGIATIYQELDLVDGLSVAENIYLGHEMSSAGWSRRGAQNAAARKVLARLGHAEIGARTEVGTLSSAGKQIVSMARALSHDARLIVMDEPSAVLAHNEVANLFGRSASCSRRASPSSTSPTDSRRSARSAIASRSSRTAAPSRRTSPPPRHRPLRSSR